jgi:excisionase family DNA binding protein
VSKTSDLSAPSALPAAPESNPPKSGLKLPEAAAYSGLTVWKLRTLIWERKIPYLQEGKGYLILRKDLDRFLETQRYKVRA